MPCSTLPWIKPLAFGFPGLLSGEGEQELQDQVLRRCGPRGGSWREGGGLTHRNVNREPRRDVCWDRSVLSWVLLSKPLSSGDGVRGRRTLCCLHLVLAPSESDGRARLDWAQTGIHVAGTWKKASIEKTLSEKQPSQCFGSARLLN